MQQEHLARHLPPCRQAGTESALVLLDQMAEVVDHGLPLRIAGAGTEEIECRLDLETFLIPERKGVPLE